MHTPAQGLILTADIGGTNSRFALFQVQQDAAAAPRLRLVREQHYAGKDFPSFSLLLHTLRSTFFQESPAPALPLLLAVFAPAGPVEGEVCRTVNIPWIIRAEEIRATLGIDSVYLLNDFAAQAHACLMPEHLDLRPVLPGTARPECPQAVVGAGTGFGKALLLQKEHTPREKKHSVKKNLPPTAEPPFAGARVLSSEGGHAEFPFVGREEYEFAEFVRAHTGQTSLIGDAIVSGAGLAHLFAFHTGTRLPPEQAGAELHNHPAVLEWFARFYGRICRNYLLDTLALGGMYITGGMASRVPVLHHPAFAAEFHNSPAQARLIRDVPVWHMQNPRAGLWGAAVYGLIRWGSGV